MSSFSASSVTDVGSKRTAASPATSGRLAAWLQTTGIPSAKASATGSPNPSYNDGKTKAAQFA